ncbi:MAG: response regulator transcription factor [Elusimicrobiota bacterium]
MSGKILIAEDEEAHRILLERILKNAGYEPTLVENGYEATKSLENHNFDAVILDWNMPKMDGGEVASWIRKHPKAKRMPILMLTVRRLPEQEVQGFECGADDFLTKPYTPKELLARIERLMNIDRK